MEVFLSTLTQTVISGFVILLITQVVKKYGKDAERASEVEKRIIQVEFEGMGDKLKNIQSKIATLEGYFQDLNNRMIAISLRQEDMKSRMHEVLEAIEVMKTQSFGKVIHK